MIINDYSFVKCRLTISQERQLIDSGDEKRKVKDPHSKKKTNERNNK